MKDHIPKVQIEVCLCGNLHIWNVVSHENSSILYLGPLCITSHSSASVSGAENFTSWFPEDQNSFTCISLPVERIRLTWQRSESGPSFRGFQRLPFFKPVIGQLKPIRHIYLFHWLKHDQTNPPMRLSQCCPGHQQLHCQPMHVNYYGCKTYVYHFT